MAMYYTIWLTLTKTLSLSPFYSELSASIEMCASNGILLTAGLMLSSHFLVWLIQPIALDISDVSLNTISTMLLKYVNIKAYFLLYFITKLLLGNFTDTLNPNKTTLISIIANVVGYTFASGWREC